MGRRGLVHEMLECYADLEYARRHLAEQTDPKSREMILAGIDRLLDALIDSPIKASIITEGMGDE